MTPEKYSTPIKPDIMVIKCPIFKDLYQMVYTYFKLSILESDSELTGLDFIPNIKTEKYLKHDGYLIVTMPPNLYNRQGEIIEVIIQLSSNVITTKRQYLKLIDVLGDVGGLMEFLLSILNFITSILVDFLYNASLVKNIFFLI